MKERKQNFEINILTIKSNVSETFEVIHVS